jgi:hypothetical protein
LGLWALEKLEFDRDTWLPTTVGTLSIDRGLLFHGSGPRLSELELQFRSWNGLVKRRQREAWLLLSLAHGDPVSYRRVH